LLYEPAAAGVWAGEPCKELNALNRPQTSMYNRDKLKQGIFSPNCSSGMPVTKVPERRHAEATSAR
jgi:hypothetical protein